VSSHKLTSTSYLVLGLVVRHGPVTSYELKQRVQESLGNFWSFPHSQLYAEPERLARARFLSRKQEARGRRRRLFTVTRKGRAALTAWLREPAETPTEIRDLGLLKLFFGSLAEPSGVVGLARQQRDLHAGRLAGYRALWEERAKGEDPFGLATLELGLRFEAMVTDFWSDLVRRPPSGARPGRRTRDSATVPGNRRR
jgi:DNA-binding PadR family transcriptional regulator